MIPNIKYQKKLRDILFIEQSITLTFLMIFLCDMNDLIVFNAMKIKNVFVLEE